MKLQTKTNAVTNTKLLVSVAFLLGAFAAAAGVYFTQPQISNAAAMKFKYYGMSEVSSIQVSPEKFCVEKGFSGAAVAQVKEERWVYKEGVETCGGEKFDFTYEMFYNVDPKVAYVGSVYCSPVGYGSETRRTGVSSNYANITCFK